MSYLPLKFFYENEEQEAKIKQNEKSTSQGYKVNSFEFKENQIVKYIILVSVVLNFFYTSISIGVPFVVKEQLLLDNATVGILETMSAVGMLLASVRLCHYCQTKKKIIHFSLIEFAFHFFF